MRTNSSIIKFAGIRCSMALAAVIAVINGQALGRAAQGPALTYQGRLTLNGQAASLTYDFECRLFDAAAGGSQVGSVLAANAVDAGDDGRFTITLDFGAGAFNGQERWLQLSVRETGGGAFTPLLPRQKLTSAPYAAFALQSIISGAYGNAVNFSNATNTFSGAFSGSGAGLTNINPSSLSGGTAGISITGNAATATSAGSVSGIVPVTNGGTGANNATTARTNLGAAATSHTHAAADIASGNLAITRLPLGGSWAITSNLNVDSNTLVVDQLNDRVGIGVSTPTADLHIRGLAGLGSMLITPTTSDTLSQVMLSENSSGTFGMIMRMDGAANQLHFLSVNTGVEQAPLLSINRSSTPSIGIGTTNPLGALHVQEGSAGTISPANSASVVLERSNHNYLHMYAPDVSETGVLFGGDTTDVRGGIVFNSAATGEGLQFRTGGNTTRVMIASDGILTLQGGSDVTPTSGGYLVAGSVTGSNIAIDNNEIMARNNGVATTLSLNAEGGDVSISANGTGKLIAPVIEITGADLAEEFPFSEKADPGMVVAIDPANPGRLCVARGAYNRTVAGIIAGANDFPTGAVLGRKSGAETGQPVALSGRVYVRASDINGAIEPGDLLTTSETPGFAMKATDPQRMTGAILGKAMTAIDPNTGYVLVLVNLH